MAEYAGEKTFEPTPHRRQQARKQGQVARSHDLVSAAMLLLGLLVLMVAGGSLVEFLSQYMARQLSQGAWLSIDATSIQLHFAELLQGLGRHLLPIFGLLMLGAIAANLAQTGFLYLPERIAPDVTRLNPLQGLQRLFSMSSTSRLGLGLLKIVVIGGVAWLDLDAQRDLILGLGASSLSGIASFMVSVLLWTSLKIGAALLVLAVFDYGLQRWRHERDLKMTPQELREEMRNLEGNPELRARRRHVQQQLAGEHVRQLVPKADVVIVSPGGPAVAIRYEAASMAAPMVVAKGSGTLAERIRQLAMEHGVALSEDRQLAGTLHREANVGQPIPTDQYAAVARLLANVYQPS